MHPGRSAAIGTRTPTPSLSPPPLPVLVHICRGSVVPGKLWPGACARLLVTGMIVTDLKPSPARTENLTYGESFGIWRSTSPKVCLENCFRVQQAVRAARVTMAMGTDERQRLHHSHCTSTTCLFLCNAPTCQGTASLQSLPQEESTFSYKARGQRCSQISPVRVRPQPLTPGTPASGASFPTLAQEPLPEVTGRSYGQFCPPGVQATLGKSCLSLYSRTLELLKSVLMDTAPPAVLIVLCTGNHCPPGALVEHRLPRARQAHSPQV